MGMDLVSYLTFESPCEFDLEFQGPGVVTALTRRMKNSEPNFSTQTLSFVSISSKYNTYVLHLLNEWCLIILVH